MIIILTEYCAKISGGWARWGMWHSRYEFLVRKSERDCLETYRVSFLSCSGSAAPALHRKLASAVTSSDMIKEASCRQQSVVNTSLISGKIEEVV